MKIGKRNSNLLRSIFLLAGFVSFDTALGERFIDHLLPGHATVFVNQSDLEESLRIQKALNLDDEGRDALIEIVSGRTEVEPLDVLLSLNRKSEDYGTHSTYVLECRLSNSARGAPPTAWTLRIDQKLAVKMQKRIGGLIREAHEPVPSKANLRSNRWLRSHDDREGFYTAAIPAFYVREGRLQALGLAVLYAAKWVKSEGTDEDMKRRFLRELDKLK